MKAIITGGAGFIGSHLATSLAARKDDVICVDNFALGQKENLAHLEGKENFRLVEMDVSDKEAFSALVSQSAPDIIYHLAANSDIQKSAREPGIDFRNTFATTYAVLEAMRAHPTKRLFFASTSAVYGAQAGAELSEMHGSMQPISYYGGAKLASEAFISSYAYMNDLSVTIFRFPNVIGPRLTHGVIFDFIRKLRKNPKELEILGDGTQAKPYIFVQDLVDAILLLACRPSMGVEIYNVGVQGKTSVRSIADKVCQSMGLKHVAYRFTGGNVGWKGDVPSFQYDLRKIHQTGWRAKFSSDEAVQATLDSIASLGT